MSKKIICLSAILLLSLTVMGADKLDKIISKGTLRCGAVLDFPPMGFRDAKNKPTGFDVEYCQDLAKALGVKAKIQSMSAAQRIPALNAGKVDVVIGSTSDTLERAKSAGFSIPYFVFQLQVMVKKGSGIKNFKDLKNKKVTAALSTTQETEFIRNAKELGWNTSKYYFSSKTENDAHLALLQGKADAFVSTDTTIAEVLKFPKFKSYEAGPFIPSYDDYVSIIVNRTEFGMLNYINLFINQQVRTGRYAELYRKYYGKKARLRKLSMSNVYY